VQKIQLYSDTSAAGTTSVSGSWSFRVIDELIVSFCMSSVFWCCGPVDLEFTTRQSSRPNTESQHV